MAQLTVYIDEGTRAGIEAAARSAGVSVSRWVKEKLTHALNARWPEGYFDRLGSLSAEDLQRPEQPEFILDAGREDL